MSFDETIQQLDHILQADRARKEGSLALLRSAVQRLDGSPSLPDVEPLVERYERRDRRGVTNPPEPFVPLPRRTTHGGRFGPAVVAKLRAEALGRR
jgi:hypothetical protein